MQMQFLHKWICLTIEETTKQGSPVRMFVSRQETKLMGEWSHVLDGENETFNHYILGANGEAVRDADDTELVSRAVRTMAPGCCHGY